MTIYKYRGDKCIHVTESTPVLTPKTFRPSGTMVEQDSLNKFYDRIPVDDNVTIIDIGAQTGLYTLYSKFLPRAQFHSFEPFRQSFDILNENIELNSITNVSTYNLALSNVCGTTVLNTCSSHNGLHTLGSKPMRFNDIRPIEVEQKTLDSMELPADFIKIDTEGWEYNILQGAVNTINKYKPVIQMEWNMTNMVQCGVSQTQLFELMEGLGYKNIEKCGEDVTFIHKSKVGS